MQVMDQVSASKQAIGPMLTIQQRLELSVFRIEQGSPLGANVHVNASPSST